jgi:hypothetical protein
MTFGRGSENPKPDLAWSGQVTDSLTKSLMHNSTKLSERKAVSLIVLDW